VLNIIDTPPQLCAPHLSVTPTRHSAIRSQRVASNLPPVNLERWLEEATVQSDHAGRQATLSELRGMAARTDPKIQGTWREFLRPIGRSLRQDYPPRKPQRLEIADAVADHPDEMKDVHCANSANA
jgi:hypothetical protein